MTAFSICQNVMFHHCDPAGIVFYPRYFEMINAALETWFDERLGVPFERLHGERQAAVPTVSMSVDFHGASRHGDRLDVTITPTKLGRSSLTISVDVVCHNQQRLTMEAKLVYMDQKTGRAASWPDDLCNRLSDELNQVATPHA